MVTQRGVNLLRYTVRDGPKMIPLRHFTSFAAAARFAEDAAAEYIDARERLYPFTSRRLFFRERGEWRQVRREE